MSVYDRVATASGNQPADDGKRGRSGNDERESKTAPKKEITQSSVHRARYYKHHRVIDDLHDSDGSRVCGEGEFKSGADPDASSTSRLPSAWCF